MHEDTHTDPHTHTNTNTCNTHPHENYIYKYTRNTILHSHREKKLSIMTSLN